MSFISTSLKVIAAVATVSAVALVSYKLAKGDDLSIGDIFANATDKLKGTTDTVDNLTDSIQ